MDNKTIRVCYVLSTSEKSGGANKSLLDLLNSIDRELIKPFALLRRHGSIEEELDKLDIPFVIIPFINSVKTGNAFKDRAKRIIYRSVFPKIKRYYYENQIDIVHNNSLPALAGMEVAFNLNIPFICHIREDVEKGLGIQFLNKQEHLRIANEASAKIAISDFIKESYKNEISGLEVIYDGMDTAPYYEEKEILVTDTIVASIYGNLDEQKGQIVAVKAMEVLQNNGIKNFELNIVGNQKTEYAKKVRKYVDEHRIKRVKFIDTISNPDKLKAIRKKDDINLICSSAEGLGRVTVESMLAGCLTIGASAGATKEIIMHNNTGLMFETGNHIELAGLLDRLNIEKKHAQDIAKQGQKYALDCFDIKKYTKSIQEKYIEVMGANDSVNE